MTYYMLTDAQSCSYGGIQWGPGVTQRAKGKWWRFGCSDLIHFYDDPLLAILLDPLTGIYGSRVIMWEVSAKGKVVSDHGLRYGAKTLTTVVQAPLPRVSSEQAVRFAILCALQVNPGTSEWRTWAENWLSGKDRSLKAAERAAKVAEKTRAWATAWEATSAARSAASPVREWWNLAAAVARAANKARDRVAAAWAAEVADLDWKTLAKQATEEAIDATT